MKVLFIHCTYRQKGGEDTVVREEMELLRSKGVETSLLEFNNEGGWRSLLQLPFNLSSYRKTKRKLREERPDVVHIHNLHFGASASVIHAVKSSGVPMVVTLHNYRLLCPSAVLFHKGELFTDSLQRGFPWKAIRLGVYRDSHVLTAWLAFSQLLHRCLGTWRLPERYIALTPHARNLFLEAGLGLTEEQVVVKPNFSSMAVPEISVSHKQFLYAGRLTEEKGIRLLLRVFAANRWPLRIAGSGPLEQEVMSYSKNFSHIRFLGRLTEVEMAAELASANALIFPSLWYEGMPLALIESFACGTPVIASRLGAMETMVTPGFNGLHFEAGGEQSLMDAVLHWQSLNTEEKKQYKNNCLFTYEAFYTPCKNAAQLLSLYHELAGAEDSMVRAALEMSL
jgi:glycosyltransferase involved in cell wall biosynthesis